MERNTKTQLVALVVAQADTARSRQVARLKGDGYDVRAFTTAWDALALFGEIMPDAAFVDPTDRSSCLDLLIEDLKRYGIVTKWIGNTRAIAAPAPRHGSRPNEQVLSSRRYAGR
jgi:hypothetical protein